jgi:uncharacterized GH25 family protein
MQRNFATRTLFIAFAGMLIILLAGPAARAHFPWINLEDGLIETGQTLGWTIGWGHRFPLAGFMAKDEVEEMAILGPNGAGKKTAASNSELQFKSAEALSQPGAYIVAVTRKAGFYTKTTEGGKRQSKKGLQNVIKCSRSHSCMKAIANVGQSDGKVDTTVGHPIEIIPLANPADLRPGDYLPIRVLLKGQPFSTTFHATYSGFSNENGVFAYTANTDKKGLGKLRILAPGAWLIKVDYEEPFKDPKECDVESYLGTLTFEVP